MQATQMLMLKPKAKQNTVIHANRVWWNTAVLLLLLFIVYVSGSALSYPTTLWYVLINAVVNKGQTTQQHEDKQFWQISKSDNVIKYMSLREWTSQSMMDGTLFIILLIFSTLNR